MKSKTCPSCNTSNNPSFSVCWHCGQSFDPNAAVNPVLIKKEAYDAFKLSRISLLFDQGNLKVAISLLPWVLIAGLLNYLVSRMFPDVKGLQLILLLGPSTLILGWCIKYLVPKYSEKQWDIPDNIFIAGLKTHLYALLPIFIIGLKLLLVYLPIYLLFKFTPLSALNNKVFVIFGSATLFLAQSILSATAYAMTVRYLYEKVERDIA